MTVSRLLKSWATPPASRPDRFHLLRLLELLLPAGPAPFGVLALGDVLEGGIDLIGLILPTAKKRNRVDG